MARIKNENNEEVKELDYNEIIIEKTKEIEKFQNEILRLKKEIEEINLIHHNKFGNVTLHEARMANKQAMKEHKIKLEPYRRR